MSLNASLLLALALSSPDTLLPCAPLPGWEEVAERATGKFLIFGETHGSAESPAATTEFVCAVAEQGPVLLGIEFWSGGNGGLQAAWSESPQNFREALRREMPEWRRRLDGVGSVAMFSMLQRLHALKSNGRQIDVVAFNGARDQTQRKKFGDQPGQGPHEAAQAENIRVATEKDNYRHVVVLVGAFHAAKAPLELDGFEVRPMAMQLGRATDVISLEMVHLGGESWNCQMHKDVVRQPSEPVTDEMIECGAHTDGPRGNQRGKGFSLYPDTDNGFDGQYWLGTITASAPAFPE